MGTEEQIFIVGEIEVPFATKKPPSMTLSGFSVSSYIES
jgi:hypothetical protein